MKRTEVTCRYNNGHQRTINGYAVTIAGFLLAVVHRTVDVYGPPRTQWVVTEPVSGMAIGPTSSLRETALQGSEEKVGGLGRLRIADQLLIRANEVQDDDPDYAAAIVELAIDLLRDWEDRAEREASAYSESPTGRAAA